MMRDVLIVRAPGEPREDLEAMRDYVEESLRRGVLVLSDGMELEVLSLPEPGEARISPDGPEEPFAVPTGRGAEEKRAIQEKLKAYRRARGLGCFRAVAQAGEPEVTETMLRGMDRHGGLSPERLAGRRAGPGAGVQAGHRGGESG